MEYTLPFTLVLIVAAIAWGFFQIRAINQRLTALERQHLALVADLEDKIYRG